VDLPWQSSQGGFIGLIKILDLLREGEPRAYVRLKQLLDDYQILLVVNMVKNERDTMSGLIIREVAAKYLTIQPEILGHISYDLAVEAAVNLMIPFSLDKDESKPAQDLRNIAQKVLEIAKIPVTSFEAEPTPVDQDAEDWDSLWQHAPA
jgi:MinD-like ATPase involved in chromosome partitioning or flagellar assembly